MKKWMFIFLIIFLTTSCKLFPEKNPIINEGINYSIDHVLVSKSEKKMYLMSGGIKIREYHVVFGANPVGHKQQEGDERTPEGKYVLDSKNSKSGYYKSIHISYPNEHDKMIADRNGFKPGGDIMIHGQKNGFGWLSLIVQRFNWTNGCIAVTNAEMDEIWGLVKVGTPIEIRPKLTLVSDHA